MLEATRSDRRAHLQPHLSTVPKTQDPSAGAQLESRWSSVGLTCRAAREHRQVRDFGSHRSNFLRKERGTATGPRNGETAERERVAPHGMPVR